MPVQNRSLNWLPPLLLFVAALAVRLAVVGYWRFDGLYGQDAFAYYEQCIAIADRMVNGWSALPPFFWPHGYPVLAALTVLLVGEGPVGPQLLNTILGSLLVVVVYFFARDMCRSLDENSESRLPVAKGGEACGIIAGGCTAVAGQPVLSSVVVMSDSTAAFWMALSGWMVWRLFRNPDSWWWLPLAAVAGAVAVITRRAGVLAVPAVTAITAMTLGRIRRPVAVSLLALAAVLIVVTPEFLLLESFDGVDTYLTGWSPINAIASSFETVQGIHEYRFPNGFFYAATFWHPVLMPPTLGLFVILGMVALWKRQRAGLVLLGGWYATAYLFMIGLPQQNLRFCLTLWTPGVILVALGVAAAWHRRRRLTAGLLAVSFVVAGACNIWWLDRFMGRAAEVRAVAEEVATHLPDGGRVIAFGITGAIDHYTRAEVVELFGLDEQDLARLSDGAAPTLLVVNRGEIANRWMGHSPGANVEWLTRERSLNVISEIGPWSIHRIGRETAVGGSGQ